MFIKHLHGVVHSGTRLAVLTDITMRIKGCHLFRSSFVPGTEFHAYGYYLTQFSPKLYDLESFKPLSPFFQMKRLVRKPGRGRSEADASLVQFQAQSFTLTLLSIPRKGWLDGLSSVAKNTQLGGGG